VSNKQAGNKFEEADKNCSNLFESLFPSIKDQLIIEKENIDALLPSILDDLNGGKKTLKKTKPTSSNTIISSLSSFDVLLFNHQKVLTKSNNICTLHHNCIPSLLDLMCSTKTLRSFFPAITHDDERGLSISMIDKDKKTMCRKSSNPTRLLDLGKSLKRKI
jgi:hypothetical protein